MAAVHEGSGVGGGVGQAGVAVAVEAVEAAVDEGGVSLSLTLGNVDDTSGVGDVLSLGGVAGGAHGVVGVAGALDAVGGVGVGVSEGGGVAEASVAVSGVAE